jgi:hypothetical protein
LRLGEDSTIDNIKLDWENVILSYDCSGYWAFNVNGEGLLFITFSDLVSSGLLSQTSILAFYTAVTYVAGTTFRTICFYNTDRVFVCETPCSDAVRNLIQCIWIMRLEQNLKK